MIFTFVHFRMIIFSENITGIMEIETKVRVNTRSDNVSTIDRQFFFYCSAKTEVSGAHKGEKKNEGMQGVTQCHNEELGGDHLDSVDAHIRYV